MSMPGRLVDMESQYAPGSPGLKRDRSIQEDEGPERKKQVLGDQDSRLSNGVSHANGDGEQAPKLEDISESYIPFGTLLQRMAQQTYFDLEQTIDAMADVQISEPATNGLGPQPMTDTSSGSVDKKLRMMNFAQTQKDRYIKAWVLSQWSQNIKAMDRTIQLSLWIRQQDEATHLAADGIINLKHNMVAAKMPNPNIEGALQVLSTGKAPWMPDMGYLPPKPLSAPRLLQTLRDMNFTLSSRLNLAEELPSLFNNYTIANGRATFVVPGEFEVDLATVDEDPASPFYFIDIRLLFSPATSTTSDRLRTQLEGKVNDVLATGGLQACYDFLHGFVLTHKLNILYSQALEMSRGKWVDNISIQMVHRSVIIQYWKKQKNGRNWVELGIVSGKNKKRAPGTTGDNSHISCRWFRRGQEVQDHGLSFDLQNLSMEKILDQVIATHATGKLNTLSEGLGALSHESPSFGRTLDTFNAEASRCSLQLVLKPLGTVFAIGYEPVTGSISLSPRTPNTFKAEQAINADPSVDTALAIRSLLCREIQSHIVKHAQSLGWTTPRLATQANLRFVFPDGSVRRVILQDPRWGSQWGIAASIDLFGVKWWILRLSQGADGPFVADANILSPIPFDHVDQHTLSAIAENAITEIGLSSLMDQMGEQNIPFSLQHGHGQLDSISISARSLLGATRQSSKTNDTLWCNELVSVTHHGLRGDTDEDAKVMNVLGGSLTKNAMTKFLPHVTRRATEECGIAFDMNGSFEIAVETRLGQPILQPVRTRLRILEKLFSTINVALENRFNILKASPGTVSFAYSKSPKLVATVELPALSSGDFVQARLRFSAHHTDNTDIINPHERIHGHLERTLNDPVSAQGSSYVMPNQGFIALCWQLRFTLSALLSFSKLEKADPYARFLVHCRDGGAYGLEYRLSPSHTTRFSVLARRRNQKLYWHIKEVADDRVRSQGAQEATNNQRLVSEARTELNNLWKGQGKGWTGLRNGAYAESFGITELLGKIDGIVRGAKLEDALLVEEQKPMQQQQQQPQPQKAPTAPPQQQQQQQQQKQVKAANRPQNKPQRGNQPNPADVVVLD